MLIFLELSVWSLLFDPVRLGTRFCCPRQSIHFFFGKTNEILTQVALLSGSPTRVESERSTLGTPLVKPPDGGV